MNKKSVSYLSRLDYLIFYINTTKKADSVMDICMRKTKILKQITNKQIKS